MPTVWTLKFVKLALLAAGGLAIGWFYGQPLAGLLIAVVVALLWQLFWLFRLERWLSGYGVEFMPEGSGIWPRVFARIDFLRRRSRRRGKRFKTLVKQLRHATRKFPDGGVILNDRNEIVVYNRAAELLLGLKKSDRGMRVENLLRHPDFVHYLRQNNFDATVELASPLHNERWVSCHLVAYGLNQKMLLIRDVTRQRRADEMRREFVANASHELRTPLTVISGYLDALTDDPGLDAGLVAPVAEMQKQSARMKLLVEDLLKLSELEAGERSVAGLPVQIQRIVESVRSEVSASGRAPANFEINLESGSDLCGTPKDIHSVVSNLVSNAVRYTPADGRIEIRWWTNKKGGYLAVSDSGIGIAKQHIPRLSERFYRVEDGRERLDGQGGTGLGLAIVKHALLRHDAKLVVSSELGKGSVFTCEFPPSRVIAIA